MPNEKIKRIAVFTSGGDAPGMNAAIRAVVRTAAYHDLHIFGIHNGYEGMIDGDLHRLDIRDVGNIIYRGGTILKTARSKRFMTPEGRRNAYEALQAFDVDACVAIGGDGTFTGAKVFSEEYDIPIVGIPGTIDNDLFGTDYTIGYDTAVNTAVQAVDKIRDTADSHNRLFFVEVMGRNSGFIALSTGIASGAGNVMIPEVDTNMEHLIELLRHGVKRKKMFGIIVVAEGNKLGPTAEIAQKVQDAISFYDTKVTIIGHMQRGGSPSALDRLLASRLGFGAVEGLLAGQGNVMIGLVNNEVVFTPFTDAITIEKKPNQNLVRMAEILAI
ncbi:MAG: 6-phosphofructokinase [Lewinella sp.]|jgi:6-phosphofructokinase 1|uniref:6-phosphofructokinase n=1 Tax=Lewinella TaxID=70994 RepID=UPI00035C7119|nr:6-phosphofructokinase [Lewinella cohaerens]